MNPMFSKKRHYNTSFLKPAAATLVALLAGLSAPAKLAQDSMPRLVTKDGRHALLVDGEPFLILGAQCHNSSGWSAMLPQVWQSVDALHANTLGIPIYWEQFEPEPGRFDTSVVDTILKQAREHNVRLVLLWFATWKNGSSHYAPQWAKNQPEKFRKIICKDGTTGDSPSPLATAWQEADSQAFRALMHHLKIADPKHTVIMVQVENEPGSWSGVRDFSPQAEKLFHSPVPAELLQAMTNAPVHGNWPEVFGANADEFFQAWHVARFINQVAAAGKAEYSLPMYVNVALRDPITPPPVGSYESGAAIDHVIWLWKIAAPEIDLLAPDIYLDDPVRYRKIFELYELSNNALFVPETLDDPAFARMCFAALNHGAIGWSPFGLDYTDRAEEPLGAAWLTPATVQQFALNYRILRPVMREVARLNFEGQIQAVAEEKGEPTQTLDFGDWTVTVGYGIKPPRGYGGEASGHTEPIGRALVAQTGKNQFLVTGAYCRIDFKAKSGAQREYRRVEEIFNGSLELESNQTSVSSTPGQTTDDQTHFIRILNGDETDWGLDFGSTPQVERVTLSTY